MGFGALTTCFLVALKGPSGGPALHTAMGGALKRVLPAAAAVGAVYSAGNAAAAEALGGPSWRAQAFGGMLAGVVVLGAHSSLQAGFIGGLAAAGAAGALHLASRATPDMELASRTPEWLGITAGSRNFPNPNKGPEEAGFAAAAARERAERVRAVVGGQPRLG